MIDITMLKRVFKHHFQVAVEESTAVYDVFLIDYTSDIRFEARVYQYGDVFDFIEHLEEFFDIERVLKEYEATFIKRHIVDYKAKGVALSFEMLEDIKYEWDRFRSGICRLFCKVRSEMLHEHSKSVAASLADMLQREGFSFSLFF